MCHFTISANDNNNSDHRNIQRKRQLTTDICYEITFCSILTGLCGKDTFSLVVRCALFFVVRCASSLCFIIYICLTLTEWMNETWGADIFFCCCIHIALSQIHILKTNNKQKRKRKKAANGDMYRIHHIDAVSLKCI